MSRILKGLRSLLKGGEAATAAEGVQAEAASVHLNKLVNSPEQEPQSSHMTSSQAESFSTSNLLDLSKLQKVAPHIPLIKFRKGLPLSQPAENVAQAQENVLHSDETSGSGDGNSLEWWQIPSKYRRPAIDSDECNEINSGGAETVWR
eukprot:TRINITY_DN56919_c0_g1_i1.p1 TRINITY_DN56919_c0_g1~~TRINITY_DN56919_c0_g1_i1.p1  ORF type:complete len:148 (+),score=16.62 TRINITY_DN56919_c0_g1_i1:44-487(+)